MTHQRKTKMTEGWQALILLEPRLGEVEKKANYAGRAYMKLIHPQVIRIQKYYRVLRRRVHIAITRIQEQYRFTIILKRCFLQGLKTASSICNC